MSSDTPPETTPALEEDSSAPQGKHVRSEPARDGRSIGWRSSAGAVAVLAVAGSVAWFSLKTQGSVKEPSERAAPARGLACPYLLQAANAWKRGDHAAYSEEIAKAARIAEDTLQTSGQDFGEPETIALDLDLTRDESPTRVAQQLELALRDCHNMGSP
jgi:hypothetical protein